MSRTFDFANSPLFTPTTHPRSGVTLHVLTHRVAFVQQGFYFVNDSPFDTTLIHSYTDERFWCKGKNRRQMLRHPKGDATDLFSFHPMGQVVSGVRYIVEQPKMHIESLISYFGDFLILTDEENQAVRMSFSERRVKRGHYILQEGDVCNLNTFVVEGCFRMYMLDYGGKEHNLQFAIENWWIGDIASFHSEEPSRFFIEAIENSVVLQIKKEDQLRLFVDYPNFNRIFRVFTENELVSYQRRVIQNISSTAEERYVDFTNRFPGFLNRISNIQIASFLGITPEYLSTIRKKLSTS